MVITNFKKFLQEGGTQTSPQKAIEVFQQQVTSAGGTVKPSALPKSYGGGGGGRVSVPTPSIPTPEPSPAWSGKVEEISPKGEVVSTKYFVEGKQAGEVKGGYAYVPPTVAGATLGFGGGETVSIGKEGIATSGYIGSEIFVGGLGYSVGAGKENAFIESMLGKGGAEKNQLWNYDLGKPYGTISPAKTGFESFRTDLPPIRRTIEYGKEKVKGWLAGGEYSPFKEDYYQAQATGRLLPLVEVGAYFTPFVGGAMLVGLGGEAIVTKKGRETIFATSKEIKEQYGIPTLVSTPAQFGLAGGAVFIGGKSLIGNFEKALKFPKIETNVLGMKQSLRENQIVTDVIFEAKVKRLFGTQKELGFARASTDILGTGEEGLQLGRTMSFGTFGEVGVKLPSAEAKMFNLKQFNVISGAVSKPTEITKSLSLGGELKGFTISKEFGGTKQFFAGRGVAGKSIFAEFPKMQKFRFLGGGGTMEFEEYMGSQIFGKTFPVKEGQLLKQGRGMFKGFIFKQPVAPEVEFISGGKGVSLMGKTKLVSPLEVSKVMSATTSAVASQQKIISSFKMPLPSTQLIGFKQVRMLPEQKTMQKAMEQISKPMVVKQQKFFLLAQPLAQPQTTKVTSGLVFKDIQKEMLKQASALKIEEVQKTGVTQILGIGQKTSQQQRQQQKQMFKDFIGVGAYPITPMPKFPFFLPPLFPMGRESPVGLVPYAPRGLGRTPSFAAAQLGLYSFKPLKMEFTGLIERPLIKRKRKR